MSGHSHYDSECGSSSEASDSSIALQSKLYASDYMKSCQPPQVTNDGKVERSMQITFLGLSVLRFPNVLQQLLGLQRILVLPERAELV